MARGIDGGDDDDDGWTDGLILDDDGGKVRRSEHGRFEGDRLTDRKKLRPLYGGHP
jgi:hypothetical protein